jgi:uncharacterized protein YciI
VFPLGAQADESRLLLACEELRHRRLDRSRPLWEMWFLPGLPDRRVGLFMKVHHAIADGMAGIAALGAFVDTVPDPPESSEPPWTPAAPPSTRALFEDNVRRRLQELGRTLANLDHPAETVRQARRSWPAVHEAFTEARSPRTSLNRRIGWHRRFALIRSDLDLVKRIAHAHDAKVNDVLMVVLAGGLRELLLSRGEPVDGLLLRAAVPVSLHKEQPGQARGNLDGMMAVPLPVGEPDEVRRLRLIAAETAVRKRKHRPQGGTLFRNVLIQRAAMLVASHQRVMNTYAAVDRPTAAAYSRNASLWGTPMWRQTMSASPHQASEHRLLRPAEPGGFVGDELDGLPEPARRHLAQAITPGTPLATSARLRMRGHIKLGRWLPFRARQVLDPHNGFIWAARTAHAAYWRELGLCDYLGRPFADRSGGLITFHAESDAQAEQLVADDPFVSEGVLEQHWLKQWVLD